MAKYIKLFEDYAWNPVEEDDFDLDSFLDNPNAHQSKGTEIEEGDYVTSHRGPGQVLNINGEMAKVQLASSDNYIATVPVDMLKKISREEYEQTPQSSKSKERLAEIYREISEYTEQVQNIEDEMMIKMVNADQILEYLETALLDVINICKEDPGAVRTDEYSGIVNAFSYLADVVYLVDTEKGDQISAMIDSLPQEK